MKKILAVLAAAVMSVQMVSADNDVVTTDESRLPVAARETIKKNFPDASLVDTEFLGNHMAGLAKRWLAFFSSAALAAVVLHLVLTLRSLGLLLCVLVPVASGIGVSLAILSMLGEPITLINAIFIIFAICIAQDYAVFLSFAKLGREKSGLRAVTLSAFTTTAAFGALAVADHPVLKGIGLTSALSIFLTFLATVMSLASSSIIKTGVRLNIFI